MNVRYIKHHDLRTLLNTQTPLHRNESPKGIPWNYRSLLKSLVLLPFNRLENRNGERFSNFNLHNFMFAVKLSNHGSNPDNLSPEPTFLSISQILCLLRHASRSSIIVLNFSPLSDCKFPVSREHVLLRFVSTIFSLEVRVL